MNETNKTLTSEEILLSKRLRELRISGMANAFETQIQDPNANLSTFIERFSEIVNTEWQIRYDKKFNPTSESSTFTVSCRRSG